MSELGVLRSPERAIPVSLILFGFCLVLSSVLSGVQTTADDGFYYLKIAQEIARGHGSTFDGLHATNGYHPLWLLTLVPLCAALTPNGALVAAVLLQGLLWSTASATLYLTSRTWFPRAGSSLAALAFMLFTYREAAAGLEFSLHAFCLATTALLYSRLIAAEPEAATRRHVLLGCLAGALCLARLETIFLAVLLGLVLFMRGRRAGLAFGAPVVICALAYSVTSIWLFGHAFPVSGAVKLDWSAALVRSDPSYVADGRLWAKAHHLAVLLRDHASRRPMLLAGPLAGAISWLVSRRASGPFVAFQRPFVVYALAQLVGYGLVFHGGLSTVPWYFVVQPWLSALWAGALFDRLMAAIPVRVQRFARAVPMLAWCLVPLLLIRGVHRERERLSLSRLPLLRAAEWARDHLPEDATIGSWNAGTIGYLSGRRVVDLDGVVNSWQFFLVERSDLCSYWQRNRITHIVDAFENGQAMSVLPTLPSYAACAGRLELIGSAGEAGSGRVEIYRLAPAIRVR